MSHPAFVPSTGVTLHCATPDADAPLSAHHQADTPHLTDPHEVPFVPTSTLPSPARDKHEMKSTCLNIPDTPSRRRTIFLILRMIIAFL